MKTSTTGVALFALESQFTPVEVSSAEWSTPVCVFRQYDQEFGFTLDACATTTNAKCKRYFTQAENGLVQDWTGETVWCNPPYGRGHIEKWAKKAYEASLKGATVVMLLPSDTGTGWWHDWCARGEYRFLRGRLKFGGCKTAAPFPSVVVIFRGRRS